MARKKIIQKSKGKARGAAPPLSLKNLSPLAWIFSAKGRSCSRGRGLGAWGRHLMVPELALRRARKNLVFLRRAAPGKSGIFLRRAAPGKIRCFCGAQRREKSGVFLRRAAPENLVFWRRVAPDFLYFLQFVAEGDDFSCGSPMSRMPP